MQSNTVDHVEQMRREIARLDERVERLYRQGKERLADTLDRQADFMREQLAKLVGTA